MPGMENTYHLCIPGKVSIMEGDLRMIVGLCSNIEDQRQQVGGPKGHTPQ